eukprot:1264453-Pyramimonas_sp.AAC.1
MVEHQGAVGLRGGMYKTTQYSKDACSDISACAQASYFRPTSLRRCTPEVHAPAPLGNFLEYIMHGNMRCDAVPPPPPRRLAAAHQGPRPATSDYDLRGHWIGVAIFGL